MADLFGNPFANLSGGGIGDQASRNVNVATLNNTPGGGDADNPFLVNQTGSGQISQNTGGNPFALRPSALAGRTTAFGGQAFDPFGGDGDGGGGGFGDPSDERGTAIDDDIQDFMGHVGLGLGMVSNPAVALGKIGFEAFTGVPLSIQAVTNIANGRSAGDDGHEGDVESMGGDHGAPPGSGTGAGFGSNADEFGGLDPDGEQGGDGGADDGNGGDGQNGEGDDGGPEGLAYGGYVSGPGGPRDDEIDARLSDGEYVIDAETVDAFGPEFFEMLQEQGQGYAGRGRNAFADGGLVEAPDDEGGALDWLMDNADPREVLYGLTGNERYRDWPGASDVARFASETFGPGADVNDLAKGSAGITGGFRAGDAGRILGGVGDMGSGALGLATMGAGGAAIRGAKRAGRYIDEALGIGDKPAREGIRAYHGSPHDFDEFSTANIGTGEGVQAYGHGLYFAGKEDVAKQYKRDFESDFDVETRWAKRQIENAGGDVDAAIKNVTDKMSRLEARRSVISPEDRVRLDEKLEAQKEGLEWLHRVKDGIEPKAHMYEVRIDADEADFLDFDAPLSEQPAKVQAVLGAQMPGGRGLKDQFDELQNEMAALASDRLPNGAMRDEKRWHELANRRDAIAEAIAVRMRAKRSGGHAYNELVNSANARGAFGEHLGPESPPIQSGPSVVSRSLADNGIPGIKYLDGNSRAAGEGSRNYVVFNDELISIVRKYGIAGLFGAGLTAVEVEKFLGDNPGIDQGGGI